MSRDKDKVEKAKDAKGLIRRALRGRPVTMSDKELEEMVRKGINREAIRNMPRGKLRDIQAKIAAKDKKDKDTGGGKKSWW
jgi:hypothetical protein